jgi:hypothetical protein
LLYWAPVDFFLFPRVKRELAGFTLTQENFKKEWKRPVRTLWVVELSKAFRWWYETCE